MPDPLLPAGPGAWRQPKVVLQIPISVPLAERGMLWITLAEDGVPLTELGSAPLQLAISGP